jgi:hypothetical protein
MPDEAHFPIVALASSASLSEAIGAHWREYLMNKSSAWGRTASIAPRSFMTDGHCVRSHVALTVCFQKPEGAFGQGRCGSNRALVTSVSAI